jgi:hypothetical protein
METYVGYKYLEFAHQKALLFIINSHLHQPNTYHLHHQPPKPTINMSDYKPTEHDGLRKDGQPDKRVGTGGMPPSIPILTASCSNITQSSPRARSTQSKPERREATLREAALTARRAARAAARASSPAARSTQWRLARRAETPDRDGFRSWRI